MMYREVKRFGLLRIISLMVIFVAFPGGIGLVYVQTKQTVNDTRATDSPLMNAVAPGLSGVSYSAYANDRQDITFKAARISLRNRRFDGHILNFCKDIVISELQVRVRSQQYENAMDWAYSSHLDSISSALFFDYRMMIYNEIANINIRFVIQPLRVDLMPKDGQLPSLSIYADSMIKESLAHVLTFKGNFRLFLNDRKFIRSPLAKWDLDHRRFLFPAGFVIHSSFYPDHLAVDGENDLTIAEIKNLLTAKKPIPTSVHELQFGKQINRKGNNRKGIVASFDFERIRKNLDKLDKMTQKMIVLELLATNPGLFKQMGLSPALILFPNFQLGAFKPGPFFAGLRM